jgi:hypothetical protein
VCVRWLKSVTVVAMVAALEAGGSDQRGAATAPRRKAKAKPAAAEGAAAGGANVVAAVNTLPLSL